MYRQISFHITGRNKVAKLSEASDVSETQQAVIPWDETCKCTLGRKNGGPFLYGNLKWDKDCDFE